MVDVVRALSERATALGTKFNSLIAASTFTRTSLLTGRVLFITCDTVVNDTPARAATSLMVAMLDSERIAPSRLWRRAASSQLRQALCAQADKVEASNFRIR